jgi:uncharacterized protein YbjT (DUF2867 family)
MAELHVVTGAFGYSGGYIARRLLAAGHRVRTLTGNPDRPHPLRDRVEALPFHFDQPEKLTESLRGATVLYNTYWVRFSYRGWSHQQAVENTRVLFRAAKAAGVQRVVHVSILNPDANSPLAYYRGKAQLEQSLIESGLSYAILRPAILFGREDILINNIAWMLRHLPVVPLFGDGSYRVQPIYVEDLAALAVEQGQFRENAVIQAIGPETFTYRELMQTIGRLIGHPRPLVGLPNWFAYLGSKMVGWLMGDVVVTWDEVKGLTAGLLAVDAAPAGTTRLTDWIREHAAELGAKYASELARRK